MTQRPSLNCESMSRVEEKQFYFLLEQRSSTSIVIQKYAYIN